MKNQCKFCKQKAKLIRSHIIPKFIFDWHKKTSVTGRLRFGNNMNKPVQDGFKIPLLCENCEGRFSKYEKVFAENIFKPLNNEEIEIIYDENLSKFSASIVWRISQYFIIEGVEFNQTRKEKIEKAILYWKDFIQDMVKSPGDYELHFYNFNGKLKTLNGDSLPINIHRYLQRSIELDIIFSKSNKTAFVYAKLPSILIIGYIALSTKSEWRQTRIKINGGKINPTTYTIPLELWEKIKQKANNSEHLKSQISEKQNMKIEELYANNSDKLHNSGTINSLMDDIQLFVENPEKI